MRPFTLSTDAARFRWTALTMAAATVAVLVVFLIESESGALGRLALAAFAVFVSKLSIFGGNLPDNPFNPWELAFVAWVIDLWIACILLAFIAFLERLPKIGPVIADAHERAIQTLKEYPGIRRWAFSGVATLVFLPIPGSGSISGTLVGQLVALSRMSTFAAVAGGSAAAVLSYAALAVFLGDQWQTLLESPRVLGLSVVVLVVVVWLAWSYVKRELQRS